MADCIDINHLLLTLTDQPANRLRLPRFCYGWFMHSHNAGGG
jgi:hypothetical protein